MKATFTALNAPNSALTRSTESEALLAAGLSEEEIDKVKTDEAGRVPLGRRGEPEEVAHWIVRLAERDDVGSAVRVG